LSALERIEWRVLGSELEASLEELRLLRDLRPPANARTVRADRYVYLRRRGDKLVCSQTPTRLGPLRSRSRARLACRALDGASAEELEHPELALPRLRRRLRDLAECRRYEDAARVRDRITALEQLVRHLARLEPFRLFLRRSLEDRLALVRLDPPLLDLLGPVARDLVPARILAQRRNLVAAASRLDERAACVEATGRRRIRRTREVACEQDRLALTLDDGVGNRHRRQQRDRVRVQRVLVELRRR